MTRQNHQPLNSTKITPQMSEEIVFLYYFSFLFAPFVWSTSSFSSVFYLKSLRRQVLENTIEFITYIISDDVIPILSTKYFKEKV